jgi:hypothetical protein
MSPASGVGSPAVDRTGNGHETHAPESLAGIRGACRRDGQDRVLAARGRHWSLRAARRSGPVRSKVAGQFRRAEEAGGQAQEEADRLVLGSFFPDSALAPGIPHASSCWTPRSSHLSHAASSCIGGDPQEVA